MDVLQLARVGLEECVNLRRLARIDNQDRNHVFPPIEKQDTTAILASRNDLFPNIDKQNVVFVIALLGKLGYATSNFLFVPPAVLSRNDTCLRVVARAGWIGT